MSTAVNFVVFGSGRSGSTLLADILNIHPQISCEREIFHRSATRNDRLQDILRRFFPLGMIALRRHNALRRSGRSIYGFLLHTKLGAEQVRHPERLLHRLHRDRWQIIWLYRRDLFRQIISARIADTTHRYHGNSKRQVTEETAPQLTIAPDTFARLVRIGVQRHQQHRALMAQLPHLKLVYEADLKQPDDQTRTLRQVVAALGAHSDIASVVPNVQPPWRTPYSQIVTNYDELQALYRTVISTYSDEQTAGLLRD